LPLDYPYNELEKRGHLSKKQNKPLLQNSEMMADDPLLENDDVFQLLVIHSPSNINETAIYTMTKFERKILASFIRAFRFCPLHKGREAYDGCPRAIILNPYIYICCGINSLEFLSLHLYTLKLDSEHMKQFVDTIDS